MTTSTIEVTDQELSLLVAALRAYLFDLDDGEAGLERAVRDLIAKLPRPGRG